MDPRPWTLRELVVMAKACQYERWDRIAELVATIAAVMGDKRATRKKFHIMERAQKREGSAAQLRGLKGYFVKDEVQSPDS